MICLMRRPDGSELAKPFTGVIYAHQQNITARKTIEDLELIAKVCEPDELANCVVFLPLR